jgi:hypothetical protein
LVEHHLAKVGVAGSNPVVRSTEDLRKRPISGILESPTGTRSEAEKPVSGVTRLTVLKGDEEQAPYAWCDSRHQLTRTAHKDKTQPADRL